MKRWRSAVHECSRNPSDAAFVESQHIFVQTARLGPLPAIDPGCVGSGQPEGRSVHRRHRTGSSNTLPTTSARFLIVNARPPLAVSWNDCVEVDKVRDALWDSICDGSNQQATVAVAHKNGALKFLALHHGLHVVHVRFKPN
jgi:hypothetical protein